MLGTYKKLLPAVDMDGDKFSPVERLRGSIWRGRDCSDFNAGYRPGRRTLNGDTFRWIGHKRFFLNSWSHLSAIVIPIVMAFMVSTAAPGSPGRRNYVEAVMQSKLLFGWLHAPLLSFPGGKMHSVIFFTNPPDFQYLLVFITVSHYIRVSYTGESCISETRWGLISMHRKYH